MKALCVDDREENLIFLESLLLSLGFEVSCAHNGLEALDLLEQEPFDLVVSDVLMPGMDGFRLCWEIRLRRNLARIPFIFHNSGGCDARDADFAHRIGATGFILSAMDPLVVKDSIQSLWRQHQEFPVPPPASLPEEIEFLRTHNEILGAKLDSKLQDYEALSHRLQGAFDEKVQAISHRLTAEGDLKKSEARSAVDKRRIEALAEIIDLSHDAVVICARDESIIYWNKGAQLLYGWNAEEAMGMHPGDLFARDHKRTDSPIAKALDRGNYEGEFRHATKDAREVFVLGRFTAIKDDNGETCVLAYFFDITERKNLEEKFLRAQRLESIGILAGGVAHDLNNMLAPILLGIPVLRTRINDKQGLSMLDTMEASATRGAQIIRQILNFSRGLSSDRSNIQVRHLLREIAEIIQETFPRNIVIDTDIPRTLWLLSADPTRLHQVFMNLCVNARDAMPKGGSLSLRGENVELTREDAERMLEGARPGRFVRITISDTGIGMDDELKAKIWAPFFTTKESGKGTGLGLSTVSGIMRQHDGFITLDTAPDAGATFSLYFPASDTTEEEVKLQRRELPGGAGQRILIVDDEYALRQSCEDLLTASGYRTLSASSGKAALELLRQHPDDIALLITDLLMPGMAGGELITLVKALRPEIASIAISGTIVTSSDSQSPPGVLANAFLNKPFSADQLLLTVHEVLRDPKR